eukprot:m51a1_g133 hypothetical protein (738) ;mRNA; f:441501-443714
MMDVASELQGPVDIAATLSTDSRDYLLGAGGARVPVSSLSSKYVWLLFGRAVPDGLLAAYTSIAAAHPGELEVVQIPGSSENLDSPDISADAAPWLSLPSDDADGASKARAALSVPEGECLCMLDPSGALVGRGMAAVAKWGPEGFPYTRERISELRDRVRAAREAQQTLEGLLSTPSRDHLLGADGQKVPVATLAGRTVALLFSSRAADSFTPLLCEAYRELRLSAGPGAGMEVVYVSSDRTRDEWAECCAQMPWLALPYEDREAAGALGEWFDIDGLPRLVVLGSDGKTVSRDARDAVAEFGADAYPFDDAHVDALRDAAESARASQSLAALLCADGRDHVLRGAERVPVSSLEGAHVALYLCGGGEGEARFSKLLRQTQSDLRAAGTRLAVVVVPVRTPGMPEAPQASAIVAAGGEGELQWLALPDEDVRTPRRLSNYFHIDGTPTLVVLDGQGKTVCADAVNVLARYGAAGFPYDQEKLEGLERSIQEEIEAARQSQSFETLLATASRDYLVDNRGQRTPVARLAENEVVALYFSAHWCGPCCEFTPKLAGIYNELRAAGKRFEVVFVSSDKTPEAFAEYFGQMPWLAVPFEERETKQRLSRWFDVEGIPTLVLLDAGGKTVCTDGAEVVDEHGAAGFPWSPEELKRKLAEAVAGLPEVVQNDMHEHPLHLVECSTLPEAYVNGNYGCDKCHGTGNGYVYHCPECNFDLHPKCAVGAGPECHGTGDEHCDCCH